MLIANPNFTPKIWKIAHISIGSREKSRLQSNSPTPPSHLCSNVALSPAVAPACALLGRGFRRSLSQVPLRGVPPGALLRGSRPRKVTAPGRGASPVGDPGIIFFGRPKGFEHDGLVVSSNSWNFGHSATPLVHDPSLK